jgi:hypothetical protein
LKTFPGGAGFQSLVATRNDMSRSLKGVLQKLTQPAENWPPVTKTQAHKDGENGMLSESARTGAKSGRTMTKILILA